MLTRRASGPTDSRRHRNEVDGARVRMTLTVNGFDTDGALGESKEFLAYVKETFENAELAPIVTRGSLDMTYPSTYAPEPLSDRDIGIVDVAARAAEQGRWSDALADAERGLKLTSLDGPFRRRLIEVAGLSACHLHDVPKARRYHALASPEEIDERVQAACLEVARADLLDPGTDGKQ